MKTTVLATAALVTTANAFVARTSTCCFGLTVSGTGATAGTVGQLNDGQNRVGGGLAPASYCIDSTGAITDSTGRGCILTPPTSQFQCDVGASASPGFSVGCDGTVSLNGSPHFYECPTGQNNEYNIYVTAPAGQAGCVEISLSASTCHSGCPPPPPAPTPAPPAPKTCPAALTGTYQYPHLIVPVSSTAPTTAAGTSYNGTITPSTSSIFNFDIPATYAGQTCSLIFLLPASSQLQTSAYSLSGSGAIDFEMLSGVATAGTTYANAPAVATDYGVTTVAPGGSYTIATFACPAGEAVGFELKSAGGTSLSYFQDFNPSPIGLYITSC